MCGVLGGLSLIVRNAILVSWLVAISATAVLAAERTKIEVHPVVDCAQVPGGVPLAIPQAQGRCLSPDIIVQDADFIGAFRGKNFLGDVLDLTLSEDAHQRFYCFTREHVGKQMAILIDGRVVTVPVIIEPLMSSSFQVNGLTTAQIDDVIERLHMSADGI